MIDRLEELLAMMDDEDEEEEEREDVPALTDRTVPAAASPEEDEGEIAAARDGGAERWDNPAEPGGGEAEDSTGEITDGGDRVPILHPAPVLAPAGRAEKAEYSADGAADADGGVSMELSRRFADEAADADGGVSMELLGRSANETAGVGGGVSMEWPGRFANEAEGVDGGASVERPKRPANKAADEDSTASAEEPARPAGGAADEPDGEDSGSEEALEDGLIWRVDIGAAQRAEAAWRRALADRPDGAAAEALRMTAEGTMGTAAERLSVEKGGELAQVVRHKPEIGLEGLYRQTVRAVRPAPQALPVEQAGRTVRAEEPGRTAALTVDELDRAVRRDSRRYDGGMTIF